MIKFLNQLDLDNKKIIMIALFGAVLFYADINFIFKPQIKGLGKSSAEVARIKRDLHNVKIDLKRMQDLKSKEALSPAAELKAKKLIAESQFSSLLQDISKIANKNEVKILQLKPSRQAQAAGKLTPFLITLDLTCAYHKLGKFINGLENLQAFVKVQSIRIEPQGTDYLNQRASLTLVTYVKK